MRGMRIQRRHVVLSGLLCILVSAATIAAVQMAIASGSAVRKAQSSGKVSGGAVVAVRMYGEGDVNNDGIGMTSTRWSPIRAAFQDGTVLSVKFTVPAGHRALFRATLSGDAGCWGSESPFCDVRVVVNGQALVPTSSDFGNPPGGQSQYEPSSMQFYTPHSYPPGTYTVTAQARVEQAGETLYFLSNILTVDEISSP